jgi:hypothetical protein
MSKTITLTLKAVSLAAAVAFSGGAAAQATYNLWNSGATAQINGASSAVAGNCGNANNSNYGNSTSCTATTTISGPANGVTVSAWSMDRGQAGTPTPTTTPGTYASNSADVLTGSGYANAQLSNQGNLGWGVKNRREGTAAVSPDHSVDGIAPGLADMVLLSFGTATVLDDIKMGWAASGTLANGATGDSDIAVLRWAGTTAPTRTNGTGTAFTGGTGTTNGPTANQTGANLADTVAGVNTAGWELVGAYSNVGTTTRDLNLSANLASSWWLIAAFNTAMVAGSTNNCRRSSGEHTRLDSTTTNETCEGGNDGFKLQYVSTKAHTNYVPRDGTGNRVPEPGTLALVGLALFGVAGSRRGWFKKA